MKLKGRNGTGIIVITPLPSDATIPGRDQHPRFRFASADSSSEEKAIELFAPGLFAQLKSALVRDSPSSDITDTA
ncbi:MAG: hypothetical protein JXA44_13515 [Methanospirillaceae archaeon]|nr:hypothetical protein [Methanospirillaceae archaeon]